MQFNFETVGTIQRSASLEGRVISLRDSNIALSPDLTIDMGIAKGIGQSRGFVTIEIDRTNRAFRVTQAKSSLDGYAFSLQKGSPSARTSTPSYIKKAGMPRGLYKEVPEMPNVFVWEDPAVEAAQEMVSVAPRPISVDNPRGVVAGDRVSWYVKPNDGGKTGAFYANGSVISIDHEKQQADVRVESELYKQYAPERSIIKVKLHRLSFVNKESN